jgi:hypothetical protein
MSSRGKKLLKKKVKLVFKGPCSSLAKKEEKIIGQVDKDNVTVVEFLGLK